jgi:hypothetical protein
MADGEIYDTFFNPPPSKEEYENEWWDLEEYPACPICNAPYGSCMDIMFEKDFGVPNNE